MSIYQLQSADTCAFGSAEPSIETPTSTSSPTSPPAPESPPTTENGIEGIVGRVREADVNWGYAQILAGSLLIGVSAAWYIKRRNAREVTKPME